MEAEDILGDSLGLIGEYGDSQGSDEVRYGNLVLKVAPKVKHFLYISSNR